MCFNDLLEPVGINSGINTKGLMTNLNNKLGWIGYTGDNKKSAAGADASGADMTFDIQNIFNFSEKRQWTSRKYQLHF